jgi:hypothetical protein
MRVTLRARGAAGLGLLLTVASPLVHGSLAAEFDQNKPIALSSTLTKIDWIIPQARFRHVDVKSERGTVTSWDLGFEQSNK